MIIERNTWQDFDDAFSPMFNDNIGLTYTREGETYKTNIKACVFPPEVEEELTDSAESTLIRTIKILVNKSDCHMAATKKAIAKTIYTPRIGDTVITFPSKNWKITSVDETQNWYEISARGVKK